MKDFRALAFLVLADIAFQLSNGLAAGYYFLTLKEKETVYTELAHLKEKGIEVPRLEEGSANETASDNQEFVGILVPKNGEQFIINGKTVSKTDLDTALASMKDSMCKISVDKNAPSGDTIYLFDMLNKHNLKIKIMYMEEQQI